MNDTEFEREINELFDDEPKNKKDVTKNKKEAKQEIRNEVPSSARCPSLTIEVCLEKIKPVVEKNGANLIYVDGIYADMGYARSGGSAHMLVASFKYYGILEAVGDKFKINKNVITFILSDELSKDAVKEFIVNVPVNKKIFEKYNIESLPSDNTLKIFLINEWKYSIQKAEQYLKIFRDNLSLYNSLKGDSFGETKAYEIAATSHSFNNSNVLDVQSRDITNPMCSTNQHSNSFVLSYPTPSGEIRMIIPMGIESMSMDDIEGVEDILELLSKKLNRRKRKIEGGN